MMQVSPEASMHRLRAPVLFLHSRGDPLIPSEHSLRLHQQAREPKQIHLFEMDGHCAAFYFERERYRETIRSFITSVRAQRDKD
jgi:fermentation-respiration switch protein FrsA (DUF1100 family)